MKKIITVFFISAILFFGVGCTKQTATGDTKIITCCSVEMSEYPTYTFYAASSDAPSDDGNGDKALLSYTVTSGNFSEAVKKLEDAFGATDTSHISLFIADPAYIDKALKNDIDHIKKQIRISSLTKFFASSSPGEAINAIADMYDGAPHKYPDLAYTGKSKRMLCTMSEMFFAVKNPIFTSSVPIVEINPQSGFAQSVSFLFYSAKSGVCIMEKNEYELYCDFIKEFGKTSKAIDVSKCSDGICTEVSPGFANSSLLTELSQRYYDEGFDILNAVFYAKKCFLTYSEYLDHIKGTNAKIYFG